MIYSLLITLSILLNVEKASKAKADDVLQKVLELEEVESLFSKSPRFSSSYTYQIVLLKSKDINIEEPHEVNHIPLSIKDVENIKNKNLIVFLHLTDLNLKAEKAFIKLKIQNATLLFEEKKNVTLEAALEKTNEQWSIKDYKVDKINISY